MSVEQAQGQLAALTIEVKGDPLGQVERRRQGLAVVFDQLDVVNRATVDLARPQEPHLGVAILGETAIQGSQRQPHTLGHRAELLLGTPDLVALGLANLLDPLFERAVELVPLAQRLSELALEVTVLLFEPYRAQPQTSPLLEQVRTDLDRVDELIAQLTLLSEGVAEHPAQLGAPLLQHGAATFEVPVVSGDATRLTQEVDARGSGTTDAQQQQRIQRAGHRGGMDAGERCVLRGFGSAVPGAQARSRHGSARLTTCPSSCPCSCSRTAANPAAS